MKNKPCEKCESNRWHTVKKGEVYSCRVCLGVRKIIKEGNEDTMNGGKDGQ